MEKYIKVCDEENLDTILGLEFSTDLSRPFEDIDMLDTLSTEGKVRDDNFDFSKKTSETSFTQRTLTDNDEQLYDSHFDSNISSIFDSSSGNDTYQKYAVESGDSIDEKNRIFSTKTAVSTFLSGIPESVSNLFQLCRPNLSDFSFVYAISAQMCQEILPMECYVEFKIGLLLSLVSIENNNSTPLPIVGIGLDTSFANQLMIQVAELAGRFISSMDKFQSSVLKTEEGFVEASSLLLAKGGVYYVGDWSRLNEREQHKIVKDISSGYVSVDNPAINYPLNAAIWCYWRNYKNNVKDMKIFGILLKAFGIPFILEEKSHDKLTDFLLEDAMMPSRISTTDDLSISFDDLKKYLEIVSKLNVVMPPECAELLKNYFIASRYERPHCLTERAYTSLQQMSESFARLSFRDRVTLSDVVGAIYLSEHFIRNVFGPCVLSAPVVAMGNDLEHVDKIFGDFQNWLYIYLTRFSIGVSNCSIK